MYKVKLSFETLSIRKNWIDKIFNSIQLVFNTKVDFLKTIDYLEKHI